MIQTPEQLEQARMTLARIEAALLALRERVAGSNRALFEAMGQDYVASIQGIRDDIDRYLGFQQIQEAATPLWMVLEGERLDSQAVSSRLLADWLGRLRKAVYNVASYLERGQVRVVGRPDARLLAATDPYVLAVRPGSIRIGVRLPPTEVQLEMFPKLDEAGVPAPTRALERLLAMVGWGASGSVDPPLALFPNTDEASVLARHAATLAPSRRGDVKAVTLSGSLVPETHPLRMEADAQDRLRGLSRMLRHATRETIIGQLREIDLDARRIILRERGPGEPDVKCLLPTELIETAERLLDRLVAATGIIYSDRPDTLHVTELLLHHDA